jgi:hypothetical protein
LQNAGAARESLETAPENPWFPSSLSGVRRSGRGLFLLIVTLYFTLCFSANPSFLDLARYTQGLERIPYQYRMLPILIFRGLMRSDAFLRLASHVAPLHGDIYRVIDAAIAFASMLGAIYATRRTIAALTRDEVFAFWAALLVPLMALIQIAAAYPPEITLPYDVPALFFFAVSIYLIVSGRRWPFLAIFPVAVLNRETICFATFFFIIWEWVRLGEEGAAASSRVRRIAPAVVLQAVVWLVIKIYLVRVFGHNPIDGDVQAHGLFATKLGYNLREVVKPQQWPILLSVCGFSLPFLVLQRRWIRRDGIFYACAIILPLYFAAMMIVGVIVEIRIFTEWIALATPALALIIHHRFRPVEDRATA